MRSSSNTQRGLHGLGLKIDFVFNNRNKKVVIPQHVFSSQLLEVQHWCQGDKKISGLWRRGRIFQIKTTWWAEAAEVWRAKKDRRASCGVTRVPLTQSQHPLWPFMGKFVCEGFFFGFFHATACFFSLEAQSKDQSAAVWSWYNWIKVVVRFFHFWSSTVFLLVSSDSWGAFSAFASTTIMWHNMCPSNQPTLPTVSLLPS